MPTQEESIAKLASTDSDRLSTERLNAEKFLGNQTRIATAVQDSFPLEQRKTDAVVSQAQSIGSMGDVFAAMAGNIDPMKADQRDMAFISAAVFATCGDFITSVTKDDQIKALAAKVLMVTDLIFTGIQSRLKK